jgi:hypothetical protein
MMKKFIFFVVISFIFSNSFTALKTWDSLTATTFGINGGGAIADSITYDNGELIAGANYAGYFAISRFWGGGSSFEFDIKNNPYISFMVKANKKDTFLLKFSCFYTDGSAVTITKSINVPTSYYYYSIDLTNDIKNLETSSGKTFRSMQELLFQFPWTIPQDTLTLFLKNYYLGQYANRCPNQYPAFTSSQASDEFIFKQTTTYDIKLSKISDGNSGSKNPVTITATSSDPSIIANPTVLYTSPDTAGTIKLIGAKSGMSTIIITVTDTAICNNKISKTYTVIVESNLAINSNDSPSLSIYPNPAKNVVTILTDCKGILSLTDVSGRIVKQANITINETKLDVSELPAGCYIISIQAEDGVVTSKLIVE